MTYVDGVYDLLNKYFFTLKVVRMKTQNSTFRTLVVGWFVLLWMLVQMQGLAQANFNCTPPAPNVLCTPPSTFDEDLTVATGTTKFWDEITSTDPQNITKKIRIKGGGKVIVRNNNSVMLKSATAVLNIENIEFIIDGGNLQLDVSGCRYLQNDGALRTYGNFQQTTETIVCITGTVIEIGEEEVGGRFNSTGNNNTAANWQNDGGYRYLKSNCINVTQDFQLQSTGSGTGINGVDVIIDCCIEIGDRGLNHATPTAFGDKDADDSGNWQNSNSQSIYGTEIVVANGNYQNNQGIMTLCGVDIKVNVTGSFQINSGTLRGQNLCIGVEDIFENSGTWTLTGISWYSEKQNSTNVPGAGAEKTKATVLACFDNNCCANLIACVVPSAIQLSKTAPTCTGSTANNNGKITLIAATNTDKCGISTLGAATYDGPAYSSATAYSANKDVKTAIPNTGGTYILRLFNGANDCFKDTTITVSAVSCSATCALTLKTTVSGCYQNNGSKSTVSVEVGWSNVTISPTANDASDAITVTFAGQSRTINPGEYTSSAGNGTIVSPQVVAFELPADASTQTVQAFIGASFAASTCKTEKTDVILPATCPPTECIPGQTGGTVWNDYNADGIKQTGEGSGVPGVTVKAYDCKGNLVGTTTTDTFGKYVFTNIPAGAYPIRVEFSTLPTYAGQGTVYGIDGQTTVQFITTADCNVDLGILDPTDYCQNAPKIVVPCFVNGNPLPNGQGEALVMFDYGTSGPKDASKITVLANASEIGSVWGVAYDKYKKRLFTSAVLRRHSGLGTLGLGGIYVTDMTTNTTTTYVDVTAGPLNINVGSIPSNVVRGLDADPTKPSNDSQAFGLIGKIGIGDIEISEDGKYLYLINLFDKKLYKLDVSGTSPTLSGSYAIPTNCQAGTHRPFGLKIYRGEIYVGSVCDGSNATKSDMIATIAKFNPTSSTFSSVLEFPLTYPKGAVFLNSNFPSILSMTGWYPWTDTFNDLSTNTVNTNLNATRLVHPQPILSDIEFDIDGSMIIGFSDRTGLQAGYMNYDLNSTSNFYIAFSGGDILRASYNGSTYLLENNAKVNGITGSSPNNNQGPGFGEFYNDDFFALSGSTPFLNHAEQVFGALALKPGSGQVIGTAMDPINLQDGGSTDAGGVKYWNNNTGKSPSGSQSGFILYKTTYSANSGISGTFSKSVGLGDLELTCDLPTYLEIGNRVWNDLNKNGVQDPCEKVLVGVKVSIYKGANRLAETQTNVNGEYYFSSKSKIGNGTWTATGADTTLLPNTAYKLVFGEGQVTGGKLTLLGLGQFDLTIKDATGSNGNDQNDSDVELISGAFCINLTTGALATVNHTFDAGFVCSTPPIGNKITVTAPTCNGTNVNNNGKISLTAAIAPYDKFRVKTGTGSWSGDTTYATATAIGTSFPKDLQTAIPNSGATYVIRFYTGECCYKDTTITVAVVNCACIPPTRTVAATDPTCLVAGKIELTATNGDKYGVSKGATYTGPAYASATAVGTLPILIKGNISHAADSTWTIRVFNKDNTCFKDTTVTVKALVKDASVTVNNGFPACRSNGTAYTIKFTKSPAGGVVTAKNVATGASIPVTGDSVANIPLTVASVRLIVTNGVCKDSITVTAPVCDKPVGSIGDLIWKDVNDNGLQDLPTEKGVAGVKVHLYAASGGTKTGPVLDTKTTNASGNYLFSNLQAGSYIVEIDKTTLPDTCAITTKKDVPSDDTKDSDFDATTGLSQVVTLNPVFNPTTPAEILATNNLTVDAGLVKVCIPPTRTVRATDPTCLVAGKIELTATNGNKYGVSKGATYTGPAYASATAVGTLPILIKGNISHAADSTWTIRVFNKDNTCFRDTTVTVKALVKDASVTVNNGFPACRSNGTAYTIKFTKSPAGAVVTAKNVATGAAIAVTGDSVANIPLTVASVRLIVTNGVCKDSITVNAPTCDKPVGSIGDLIWKDSNDNGLQDLPAEKGVQGVKVNLYAASGGTKTGPVLDTKTTNASGNYLFSNLLAGSYIVEIDKTTLPDTCAITTKQNTGSDDTKDSDINPTSGLSQVVTLNPVFNPTTPAEILATNNLTVDAGLVKVVLCPKPRFTLTSAPTCAPNNSSYSVTVQITGKLGTVKASAGTLSGNNPYTISGIPNGVNLKITDSLSAVCKYDTTITGINCNCTPRNPVLLANSVTACAGDTFPTLRATVVGLATADWFTQPTGGTAVATGTLTYKPAGTVPAVGDTIWVQARSTDPLCPSNSVSPRVAVIVNTQNCLVEIDLALKKMINKKIAQIGDELTYTIKVFNQSNAAATGVEVTDSIATSVQFVAGSFVASRGSASITGNVIKWTIGGIAANAGTNGDTVTLTYKVKATQVGLHFNTAEISKTNEKDKDSTPGNGAESEDDIDRQCFTVPVKLCPGEKVEASVPAKYTGVKWFKDNVEITALAGQNVVLLDATGSYTYTAQNNTCPASGCCPIIIEPGINCCPPQICIPFTVKKKKK